MVMKYFGMLAVAQLALAACASNAPRPTEAMTRAETSVEQADQAGARRFDPATLDMSKQKLAQAKTAADKGDARTASQLSEQAELDAELAAARARSASAKTAAAEVRASLETLRAEIARQEAAR
jgi:transposase-like protein